MVKGVLVIDDDELTRAHMAAMLKAEGFQVFEAANARLGLKIVKESNPDVVLVDLIMPEKDGIETISEIRKGWPDICIVAISGGGRIGPSVFLEIAKRLGASACLTKPLNVAEFRRVSRIDGEASSAPS